MQPRSPGSPTATCGMHACDNCAEQHRHGPFQDKALESSRGRSESRPSLAQRRTRCSRSRMGAVDKSVHKLLRALLRRSGSHRMITIGSLSSSPSSSARKPARTLPIRTRVTTTTTTATTQQRTTALSNHKCVFRQSMWNVRQDHAQVGLFSFRSQRPVLVFETRVTRNSTGQT